MCFLTHLAICVRVRARAHSGTPKYAENFPRALYRVFAVGIFTHFLTQHFHLSQFHIHFCAFAISSCVCAFFLFRCSSSLSFIFHAVCFLIVSLLVFSCSVFKHFKIIIYSYSYFFWWQRWR